MPLYINQGAQKVINNKTLYTIDALCELARCKDYSSTASKIAESTGVSHKFLPQILSDLSRAGIVRSIRGFGGGVTLAKDPRKINLLSIIETVQSNLLLYDDILQQSNVSTSTKNALKVFRKIQDVTKSEMAKVSLADIASKPRARKKK